MRIRVKMKTKILIGLLIIGIVLISGCAEKPITGIEWFQTGNTQDITKLQPKLSEELEDNRIGKMWGRDTWEPNVYAERDADEFVDEVNDMGLKWIRTSFDWFDWNEVESRGGYSQYQIDTNYDKAIEGFVNKDVKIMYILLYWDETIKEKVEEYEERDEEFLRFQTEEEIQNYLNYVQFIVHHFKGKIEYYEILNEPDGDIGQYLELDDYINLVKRVVPVIREEDPEAKIVIGAICYLGEECHHEYLFQILNSDIMPLVDGVSWHPMYGTSPEHEPVYYYDYPSIIQEIKDVASAHGFEGEYIAEELVWRTPETAHPDPWIYSDTVAAKYYARAIVMHLGMDITAGTILDHELRLSKIVVQNLCTILAGAKPTSLPIEIQSEATNIRSNSFSLPNGDKLIALWTDGIAADEDPGVNATLILSDVSAQKVMGIDVLEGFEQQMITAIEEGKLVIGNLLVKDYPIILRLTP